jgi:NADPH-dependent 2,4-dienoyl-CoA reductase/sulfur reductase-like enzyme
MPERGFEIVVAGAGPAGLAAAARAAESGARVAMVDDNPRPGGQIWRVSRGTANPEAARWLQIAERHRVEVIPGARIFAAPERGVLALEGFDGEFELRYHNLILATGARERFLPFPGWTLPNVAGAGGLQALAKSGLPVAGKRIVVAGSGPLLLAVAKYLRDHGADVRIIAEQANQGALVRFGLGLIGKPGKLAQAIALRAGLMGVRYLTGCWPVEAEGSGKLEAVRLTRNGKTWTEPCDYLACGFGLIPNVELGLLFGCRMSATGVAVDEYQRTSVPNVLAAGEVTGIGGLELSLAEGEIAGFTAAGKLEKAHALFAARDSHRRFADALERAFAPRAELRALPREDTLVCRCEDVAFARVKQCSGWREAKLHTRCGMGPCQGRVCGGAVEFLLAWRPESVRPPVFPARVSSLSAGKMN